MKIWVTDIRKVCRRREYFSILNCDANITNMKATVMMPSGDLQFIRIHIGMFLQKRPQGLLPTRFVDAPTHVFHSMTCKPVIYSPEL
jgi:hypothetical protein